MHPPPASSSATGSKKRTAAAAGHSATAAGKSSARQRLEGAARRNFGTWSKDIPGFELLDEEETEDGFVRIECKVCQVIRFIIS